MTADVSLAAVVASLGEQIAAHREREAFSPDPSHPPHREKREKSAAEVGAT
ncbi:MAG: hypothetical protein WAM82_14865 [Thermoanaerobaculia bacterium]